MASPAGSLAARVRSSSWVGEVPGLAEEAVALHDMLGAGYGDRATAVATLSRPGPLSGARVLRHFAALQAAQLRWVVRDLTVDLAEELTPLRDPAQWAQRAAAKVLRDQLAGLGPAGAEIARQLEATEGLVPGVVVEELRGRPLRAVAMPAREVEWAVRRGLGDRVIAVAPEAIVRLPFTQLHLATVTGHSDASDSAAGEVEAMVRVRRPGARRDLSGDLGLASRVIAPLEQFVPAVQAVRPGAFVELVARTLVEATDLRHEALNAIEIGVVAEELSVAGVDVARPLPGMVSGGAVAFEPLTGTPFEKGAAQLDPAVALNALVELTVGSALTHGVFLAELAPDHFVIRDNSSIGVVGFGTVGRFDIEQRRGLLKLLTALMSGDFGGQIDALRVLRAVSPHADVAGLERDLEASPKLQPMTLMMGGEASLLGGLKEAVDLSLRHGVYPPVEVALFVRNLYRLRTLGAMLPPGPGLMAALMPLVQRLPQIAAQLDAAGGGGG